MLVLILVVVEDVLVRMELGMKLSSAMSLNPCCGGRCSSTDGSTSTSRYLKCVLILVVVEDVLVQKARFSTFDFTISLNPCCGGRCSST